MLLLIMTRGYALRASPLATLCRTYGALITRQARAPASTTPLDDDECASSTESATELREFSVALSELHRPSNLDQGRRAARFALATLCRTCGALITRQVRAPASTTPLDNNECASSTESATELRDFSVALSELHAASHHDQGLRAARFAPGYPLPHLRCSQYQASASAGEHDAPHAVLSLQGKCERQRARRPWMMTNAHRARK